MKKNRIVTALTMIVFVLLLATPVYAKKKPVLNKKTVTVKVGKTAKLKVRRTKEPITWSSSNESIAVVANDGQVTGIASGKANIYANVSGKVLKCRVTVKRKKDDGVYHTENGEIRYNDYRTRNSLFSLKISIDGNKLIIIGELEKSVYGESNSVSKPVRVKGKKHIFILSSQTEFWSGDTKISKERFLNDAKNYKNWMDRDARGLLLNMKNGVVVNVGWW